MAEGWAALLVALLIIGVAAWGLVTLERALRRLEKARQAALSAPRQPRPAIDLDAPAPWKQNLVGLDGRPAGGTRARWEDWD